VRGILAKPPANWSGHSHELLTGTLAAAGVQLGAYDHAIVDWLAGFEPATVAVIAGWVGRAGARL
jgi:hypothetical protein